jgi:hypothetical protein
MRIRRKPEKKLKRLPSRSTVLISCAALLFAAFMAYRGFGESHVAVRVALWGLTVCLAGLGIAFWIRKGRERK